MCGSYIHGRSWVSENSWWKHFCKPYEVNSHKEMPTPKTRERLLVPYDAAKIVQSAMIQKDAEVIKIAIMRELPIPEHRDGPIVRDRSYEEHMIYLNEVKCIDFEKNPRSQDRMDFFIVMEKPFASIIDWGLRPWNGTMKIQRSRAYSTLSHGAVLNIEKFLPATKADLIKWAKVHWGKRNDEGEFIEKMPRCLNYKKLESNLPGMISQEEVNKALDVPVNRYSNLSEAEAQFHLIYTLGLAPDPCDRFCEMFAEAPNAFWAERN